MRHLFLFIIIIGFFSCSKQQLQQVQSCNHILLISDKYFMNSTAWKSDTDHFDYGCVPDSTVKKIKALPDQWRNHCFDTPEYIEHFRYSVNGVDVYPYVKLK